MRAVVAIQNLIENANSTQRRSTQARGELGDGLDALAITQNEPNLINAARCFTHRANRFPSSSVAASGFSSNTSWPFFKKSIATSTLTSGCKARITASSWSPAARNNRDASQRPPRFSIRLARVPNAHRIARLTRNLWCASTAGVWPVCAMSPQPIIATRYFFTKAAP